jgi:hypothetical protein
MKKSFYIMAVTMATMMMAGVAMAGSVDIGLGRMDQSEFTTLRQIVSGDYQPSASVTTETPQNTRVAEFNQADVDDIRQAMASGNVQQHETESLANSSMVDIGTGTMATGEFCDLNKLVASNNSNSNRGFAFVCP